jgi:UDP-2,3-diacylglucosamine hydrolase
MHSLFISDLHLSEQAPQCAALFRQFAAHEARGAEALYILGDLFEYWAGDDDMDAPFNRQVVDALRGLANSGCRIYLMSGNRDLLMGSAFEEASGATLIADPTIIDLYGTPTLLSHGDILCTDDVAYQDWRKVVIQPTWRSLFLTLPLNERKSQIKALRARSEKEKQTKSHEIMDVNPNAVAELLRQHGYPRLIHGHTHRRGYALHNVDGNACERWVLGEWHSTGNALKCDTQGCSWEEIHID